MGKTYIQKLKAKFNKGLIKLPLNVRLKCDRFNYSVGKLKLKRNNIKEKILNNEFNIEINNCRLK